MKEMFSIMLGIRDREGIDINVRVRRCSVVFEASRLEKGWVIVQALIFILPSKPVEEPTTALAVVPNRTTDMAHCD